MRSSFVTFIAAAIIAAAIATMETSQENSPTLLNLSGTAAQCYGWSADFPSLIRGTKSRWIF